MWQRWGTRSLVERSGWLLWVLRRLRAWRPNSPDSLQALRGQPFPFITKLLELPDVRPLPLIEDAGTDDRIKVSIVRDNAKLPKDVLRQVRVVRLRRQHDGH